MTQADSVHSTPPTNTPVDPTRRRFLSTAAGVAAGGTALALAISPAHAGHDPVFALIAAHRNAYKGLKEAERAHAQVERELQASGDLFPKVISRGNPYSGLPRPVSTTHADIDMYSPTDLFPDDNEREHAELDAAIARRDARQLPSEDAMAKAYDVEREALENLVEAVPATMLGVMALLKFQRDFWEAGAAEMLESGHISYICESVETALLNL